MICKLHAGLRYLREDIEDITCPLGGTNFIFSCWKYLSLVHFAHS